MKMSELILAIGDDNVQFQNLDHCSKSLDYSAKRGTTITFGTKQPVNLEGTEKLGLVLWLDRKLVAAATTPTPAHPRAGGDPSGLSTREALVRAALTRLYHAGMRIGARTSRDPSADDLDAALPRCRVALFSPPPAGSDDHIAPATKLGDRPSGGGDRAAKLDQSDAETKAPPPASGGEALHPATSDLVRRFSAALADKLRKAETKYGYSDGWLTDDWREECQRQLGLHVAKGDPLDVAAYAAFCWARKWNTTEAWDHIPALRQVFEQWCADMLIGAPDAEIFWDLLRKAQEHATPAREGEVERLRKALEGFDDDYMTSETHHPGYVLIPTDKFERIRAAISGVQEAALATSSEGRG